MNPTDRDLHPATGALLDAGAAPWPLPAAVAQEAPAPAESLEAGSAAAESPAGEGAPAHATEAAGAPAAVEAQSSPEPVAEPTEQPAALADGFDMTAPRVSAAQEAAEFVARIFADVQAEASPAAGAADAGEAPVGEAVGAQAPADGDEPAEPLGRPADTLRPLAGRRILILGLGASGLAMARWCVRCGAEDVTVADTREAPPQLAVLQSELPGVRFVPGAFDPALVQGHGLHAVYRSPGLAPEAVAPVFVAAAAEGIVTGGELGLFAMALDALKASHGYAPAVLAITGTNGKTTVTSLTGLLVECAGRSVAVAGNIGPTLLDTLGRHLDADTLPQAWVLELSSFQLEGAAGFEPTAATVLNVTQDHLDWHGDMQAYARAKARIFGESGLMVLNREDAVVMGMLPPPVRVKLQKPQLRAHVTFGADMPQRPGDFGIETVNGMAWLVRAQESDETARRTRSHAEEDLHIQRLIPADALRIRGRHNAVNALAALALAHAAGCAFAPMLYALREYRGEPHRVEPVGRVNEVEYFDDSKGTNVGATVAALGGLGADRRVVVILGGDGKGQDFSPLAMPVSRYVRAAVLIGRDGPQIRAALRDAGVPLIDAPTLPEAVRLAAQRAHAGDAVLMSPACASFDMFRNYEHRAEVFREAVQTLADEAGQALEGGLA
ncbi:UDP-N-acetylmuramoyl-L-alanine--D-glutamate ligase [Paracidovorax citrulli]|uniref:UDP-N-acetylmuramoyl-L-alanine--D-glutamate ligase n=1 Tax=Paracidovorax citrulli TaxID=80869 RepID=UPI00088C05AD|nr:UDP-N-acetylmuramoyl-L-alanine--D-glutamate ligase [Paracidovorax citrulli]QCX11339.1 UDP-N-acetylmuramoylalanine--D-glutamate ligase [Paracidovorax citrulli]UEG45688.1 UDP-N-acetylmuramoyl-L-alanine--D-glutamate ligase [Paracidovorax citrulli]WIY34151.1 UDP-N-acetylmuramoyl-L-alanine--D-glutamate ligase [Paracidovorax citrulli]SDJ18094.1 UDP-N-acetylmuramoylalanine--D-glutamate ligase [Paracidovorax citrulli]